MTNERLEEVIRQYNAGEFPSYASFRVLSDSVCFGRVWRQPPAGKSPSESGDYLYFVLNGAACVGVVLDMRTRGLSEGGQDLHWYVLEEHRGKGHLHRALHSVILQHMFQDGRENQRATVRADDARALEYAERQGFQVLGSQGDEIKMLLGSTDQYKDQEVSGMNRSLTKQERDELKHARVARKSIARFCS